MICPFYKNKEIFDGFNLMVEALGGRLLTEEEFRDSTLRNQRTGSDYSAMEAAYKLYHRNNGNFLDKTPNGETSILFLTLLDELGDKKEAIKAKSRVYSDSFKNWFGDWINDPENASKVIDENGEPLVVYRGDKKDKYIFTAHYVPDNATGIYTAGLKVMAENYAKPSYHNNRTEGSVYALFVKAKNPYKTTRRESERWNRGELEEYDAWIYGNFPNGNGELVVRDSNQVKSAISNVGSMTTPGFSRTDDNIYHNILYIKNRNELADAMQACGLVHKFDSRLYISKSNVSLKEAEQLVLRYLFEFGIPFNAVELFELGKKNDDDEATSIIVSVHENIFNEAVKDLEDISADFDSTLETANRLLRIFPQLRIFNNGKPITKEQAIKLGADSRASAFIKDGVVYFVKGKKITDQIVFEEILHPFINTIAKTNKELYDSLLYDAQKLFPKLRLLIEKAYSSKKGFTTPDRQQELIALSLARVVKKKFEENKPESYLLYLSKFVSWIKGVFNRAFEKSGDFYFADPEKLPKMTLGELAVLLDTTDTKILVDVSGKTKNNVSMSSDEDYIVETMADDVMYQSLVHEEKRDYISTHPDLSYEEASKQFDLEKLRESASTISQKLCEEWKIDLNSSYQDELSKMRQSIARFVQDCISNPEKARLCIQFVKNTILAPNDITTNVAVIAKEYIQLFYSSDAVQAALKELDTTGKENKTALVDKLALIVVEDIVKDDKYGNLKQSFWSRLISSVRKSARISNIARKQLFDSIVKAIAYQEDLERTSDSLLHDINYEFVDGQEQNIIKTINAIKRALHSRIKALLSVNASSISKLQLESLLTQYNRLQALDLDKTDEVLKVISQFIVEGSKELRLASRELQNMENGNPEDIDDRKLRLIKTDVIGYYESLVRYHIVPLVRNTEYEELKPGGSIYFEMSKILDYCGRLSTNYDYVLSVRVNYIAEQWVENNVDIGDKEAFKRNIKLWLNNKINRGDLGFFENWVKSASASHSQVIRMIDDYIRKSDTEVRKASHAKGLELHKAYRKFESKLSRWFNPVNKFKSLCEVDDEGCFTGNFTTEVRVGQFELEEERIKKQLQKDFNITINENNEPVGEYWDIVEYRNQLDMFYGGYDYNTGTWGPVRKHRPYTWEYYINRRKFLSEDTILTIDYINSLIQQLKSLCYDEETGAYITQKLGPDRAKLLDLIRQKQELGFPFKIEYDSSGKIVGFTKKTDDEIRMAKEITGFNQWLTARRKFKPNTQKYNEAKRKIREKYGENSAEYRTFVQENTVTKISDAYFITLKDIFGDKEVDLDLATINTAYNGIRKAITPEYAEADPDLRLLTDAAWAKLKELDIARSNLLTESKISKDQFEELQKLQTKEYITLPGQETSYYEQLRYYYQVLGKLLEFLDKFHYEKKGQLVPLSIFLKTKILDENYILRGVPTGDFSIMHGEVVDEEYTQEDEFLNIDRKRYHNDKYDELMEDEAAKQMYESLINTMKEAWEMLPTINRHYKYQLPQQRDDIGSLIVRYNKRGNTSIMKAIKRLCALTSLGAVSGGIWGTILTFSLSTFPAGAIVGGVLGFALGVASKNDSIWEQLTDITEQDTDYNEEFAVRPDGSEVETIPIRWVKRLDNRSAVSTDLLKTVTQFYEMALNYKTKLDNVDMLENIEYMVHGGFAGKLTTEQERRIQSLLSTYVYGRKKTGISRENSTRMSNFEKKFSKLASLLMAQTHAKLLPWNFTSIAKNLLDSICSFIVFIGESFMHPIDMVKAIGYMGSELFTGGAFSNIIDTDSKSWTGAAMKYNGVAESVGETFEERNTNPLRRFVSRHFSMGPFTFIDYTFKGLFTNMVYQTYRLITDPSTGKKVFVNKEEAKDMYRRCAAFNNNAKLGYKAWKKSDVCLRDAYEVATYSSDTGENGKKIQVKGQLKIKDLYKDLITTKLENRVSGLIKQKMAIINGMLDDQDKNRLSTNFIGALLLQMRGWMVSKITDWTKDGRDFARYSEDDNLKHTILGSSGLYDLQSRYLGNFTAQIIENEDENYRGIYNPATGYIERGWWMGWSRLARNVCNNLKLKIHGINNIQMLTTQEKRQIYHLGLVLATLFMIAFSSYPLAKWYERAHKDRTASKLEKNTAAFAYTSTVAGYSERVTELGPMGFAAIVLEIVNSPFISNTYFQDLNTVVDAANDAIVIIDAEINDKDWKNTEINSKVSRGSFKGVKRYQKDFLKASALLPYINLFGISNAYKSTQESALMEKEKFYRSTIPFWWIEPAKAHTGKKIKEKTVSEKIIQMITGEKDVPQTSTSRVNYSNSRSSGRSSGRGSSRSSRR